MKHLILSLLFLALSSPAFAADYTCTPESFTLKSVEDTYVLHGTLETPTPGYTYKIEKNNDDIYVLNLNAPEGLMIQVIDSIEVTHTFTREEIHGDFTVNIGKSFNWGDKAIVCKEKL